MTETKPSVVYNEDCMIGMARYPDKYFDLIITSPPYNLGKKHHTGNKTFTAYSEHQDDMDECEYQLWQTSVLNECFRVLKDDGSMFYNHKNRIREGIQITPYEWIFNAKFIVKQELVWFNRSQNFDKVRFYPMTERVYWLAKGKKTLFTNNINHHDMFEWPAVGTEGIHKRAFPEKMVSDLLNCFPQGLNVLDPFTGSGTTRLVCNMMGNDFIGFEIDPEYWAAQEKRFARFLAQGRLF